MRIPLFNFLPLVNSSKAIWGVYIKQWVYYSYLKLLNWVSDRNLKYIIPIHNYLSSPTYDFINIILEVLKKYMIHQYFDLKLGLIMIPLLETTYLHILVSDHLVLLTVVYLLIFWLIYM